MLHMNNAKAAAILICIIFFRKPDDKMISQLHGFFHQKRASQRKRMDTATCPDVLCLRLAKRYKKHHQKLISLYLKTVIYTKQAIYNPGQYFLGQIRK